MTDRIKELEAELKSLRDKRETDQKVKKLKQQIKAEKFSQTKTGKVFNVIGNVGQKILAPTPQAKAGSKKKKGAKPKSVEEVMKGIDDAVGQFNF